MVKAKLGKALAKKLSDFIDEMKDKYAMTPDQTKSAIRNYYNEGYLPKDPKRMKPGDDERLALMITTNTILPNRKSEFMQDIFEQSVTDDVLGEVRKEIDLLKLRQLDPTKMTKQADGGRVGMFKGGTTLDILKGIASLFKTKGKETAQGAEKVFARNLIDEFGDVEVKEAFRIIDDRTPELEKLFYREGESKMDDLVNLLESRYMSSERLQAHPLSFKRRGPGAADRYAKINDTGGRLTDLPGGPGDRVLYYKHYGEMSPTVIQGKKVYDRPPTIFDEGTKVADKGQTIEGVAEEVSDMSPALGKMMAGMTDESDAILKNMKKMEAEAKAMSEISMAEQQEIGSAIDTFNRMMDAGDDPAEALQFLQDALKKTRTKQADGGRVKTREKKLKGGIAGLLKRIMSPKLEKEMVEKGPFQTGHRADIIGDMQQIKNVSRSGASGLEELDSLYDMVQQSPRYNEAMRGAMMKLVDYERFRAILLDDNVKLQRMIDMDPEGSEEFIRMLFREGGSEPQFNLGGLVPPQKGPMSEGMGTLYRRK
jgi:hypothetical protein